VKLTETVDNTLNSQPFYLTLQHAKTIVVLGIVEHPGEKFASEYSTVYRDGDISYLVMCR